MKIGRNSQCLCGSGKKYKHCCLGTKDWDALIRRPDFTRNLSLRGKNTYFLNNVARILDLDPSEPQLDWSHVKGRITPDHVGQIHRLLVEVWPDGGDLQRALGTLDDLSGLYSGTYTPEAITHSLSRHGLYSDSILLFDPLMYPGSVRPEYDPLIHPEKYVSHTIKCLYLWFSLAPWLSAGILKIIRSPADFDHALRWNSLKAEEDRVARHPELKAMMDQVKGNVDIMAGDIGWATEYFMLAQPDEAVRAMLERSPFSKEEVDSFMIWRKQKKASHPYYTEQRHNEMLVSTLGESYGMSRMVANMSGAFLLTDNTVRWKMIELDRRDEGANDSAWEPFASAMQRTQLRYLDNLSLADCLKVRNDGLLLRMRSFLRRVWGASKTDTEFSSAGVEQFAAELDEEVAAAEEEWRNIDANLARWFLGETAATIAAAPTIGVANAAWLAASLSLMGVGNLADAHIRRRRLADRLPGAFFLGPKKRDRRIGSP